MSWRVLNNPILWIFLLFFSFRILFLGRLPIFNDEAIILSFSRIFLEHPGEWIRVMSDGKQPLFGMTMGSVQLLPLDPVIAGRLAMVAWSLVTFWGSVAVAKKLGLTRFGLIFYGLSLTFCPYLLFYDRIALPESPVVAIYMLIFGTTLTLLEKPDVRTGVILGLLFAVGWWHFSLILLAVPPVALLSLITILKKRADWRVLYLSLLVAGIIFFVSVLPIVTSDYYKRLLAEDPKRFITMQDLRAGPFVAWWASAVGAFQWIIGFGTPFYLPLALFGVWKFRRDTRILAPLLFFLLPILISVVMVKLMSARNLVFVMPSLLLLAALGIEKFPKKHIAAALIFVVTGVVGLMMIVMPLRYYELISFSPAAHQDFAQYVTNWPSGYGVVEAAEFLKSRAKVGRIIVAIRFDSGNPEDGMRVLLRDPNIFVAYVFELEDILPAWSRAGKREPIYFVSRGTQLLDLGPYLEELVKFKKPLGEEFVGVYRLHI